jgi:hypothetical protein
MQYCYAYLNTVHSKYQHFSFRPNNAIKHVPLRTYHPPPNTSNEFTVNAEHFLPIAANHVNRKSATWLSFRVVFWDILPCKMIVDRRFRDSISQKTTLNIILAAVRTWNLTWLSFVVFQPNRWPMTSSTPSESQISDKRLQIGRLYPLNWHVSFFLKSNSDWQFEIITQNSF